MSCRLGAKEIPRAILISVDLRTVSRNIIQILNRERYLAIVNACGSFHRGAPRVKPVLLPSWNLTRAMRRQHAKLAPKTFSPFPPLLPLPSWNRLKSIKLSIHSPSVITFPSRLDFFLRRFFFWKSRSRFFFFFYVVFDLSIPDDPLFSGNFDHFFSIYRSTGLS